MIYRRRASPLHAARAGVAISWCVALALASFISSNPIWLAALGVVVLAAGGAAGVGREMRRCLRFALPLGITICLINALVTRDGLTVIWRLGDIPILGTTNITLEATLYGAVLGLRAVTLVLLGALYTAAIDPDDVLRLFRAMSFSSALSATVATRMMPVLIRDSHRLADARRCRPGPPPGRVQLMRAITANVLDRALNTAATLEVRGYDVARRHRVRKRPGVKLGDWSRHDLAFAGSAVCVLAVSIAALLLRATAFSAYPLLHAAPDERSLGAALALALSALLPFVDRRGTSR